MTPYHIGYVALRALTSQWVGQHVIREVECFIVYKLGIRFHSYLPLVFGGCRGFSCELIILAGDVYLARASSCAQEMCAWCAWCCLCEFGWL